MQIENVDGIQKAAHEAPWWISSFVPNREAELGFVVMFASMIPVHWLAGRTHD
jgi:hypothetical protein